jgi:hypothetical protein
LVVNTKSILERKVVDGKRARSRAQNTGVVKK